jgi:dipeptidyl aminopeptidase/acylaminoacyl peptidase
MDILSIEDIADAQTFPAGTVRIRFRSAVDGHDDWALFRPGDPAKPVIVNIHGAFSTGDQIFTRQDIREHWLTVFLRENLSLLCPNARGTTYMCPRTVVDTNDLLDLVGERFVPQPRFIFWGGSHGASSSVIFAVCNPERVSGLVALGTCDLLDRMHFAHESDHPVLKRLEQAIIEAYGGTPDEVPEKYQAHSALAHADRLTMPFFLASGERDVLVPIEKVRLLAAALKDKPTFRFQEIPGGDHDSPLWLPVEEMLGWVGYEAGG